MLANLGLDPWGNVYITGHSSGIGTGQDYATIKYSAKGEQLYVLRYEGNDLNWEEATAIAIDESGNVYVTGNVATIK